MEKPPIVLLHAALGAGDQLAPLAQQLDADFTVLTLDFDGHGARAARAPRLDYAVMAEDVTTLLDAHGIESAPIFGHSMGGYVGFHLCVHSPARVKSLHTLGTFFDWDVETSKRMLTELDAEVIAAKVPKYAAALDARHTATGWREVVQRTADLIERTGTAPPLTREHLHAIQQPVRIGVGDRDQLTPVGATAELAAAFPNGELIVFPRTGHPIERAPLPLLARSITDFARSA